VLHVQDENVDEVVVDTNSMNRVLKSNQISEYID